jgi:hypothetical protein
VNFRFDAEEWAQMTPAQRVKRCIVLANEAQKLADQAGEKFKPLYADLAAQWQMLAAEIGKAAETVEAADEPSRQRVA